MSALAYKGLGDSILQRSDNLNLRNVEDYLRFSNSCHLLLCVIKRRSKVKGLTVEARLWPISPLYSLTSEPTKTSEHGLTLELLGKQITYFARKTLLGKNDTLN